MFSIGDDELEKLPDLGEEIFCTRCNKIHPIKYGTTEVNGVEVQTKTIAAYKCDDGKLYLAGFKGKDIRR